MNKKNINLPNEEIDILNTLKKIWKDKILILFNVIIFVLLSHLYVIFTYDNQKFLSIASVKPYPDDLLSPYNNITFNRENLNSYFDFNYLLKLNLLSHNNLQDFLIKSKSNEFNDFKKFLIKKNISASNYFSANNFGLHSSDAQKDTRILTFFVKFPNDKEGNIFLNNYIIYTKDKTLDEIKNIIQKLLKNKIYLYERDLMLAKEINLETFALSELKNAPPQSYYYYYDFLYNRGVKKLEHDINTLKDLLKNLDNNLINYDPLLSSSIIIQEINKPNRYYYSAFVFGLFLSFVIIFLKTLLRKT